MTRKNKRLAFIAGIGFIIALAMIAAASVLRDEIVFFFDPTEVLMQAKIGPGENFRLGGLVEKNSFKKEGMLVSFRITDGNAVIPVVYEGLLPDLFREGQGVIAEGLLTGEGTFVAGKILAKHDENYVPKELESVLKKKQIWKGDAGE